MKPVTSLDVKFDKHTRELEKFKGRHAWDAPRAAAIEKARGTYVEEATASTTADSLLVKAQTSIVRTDRSPRG